MIKKLFRKLKENKTIAVLVIIVVVVIFIIVTAKFLSKEDSWICSNGKWIKHGNPNVPAPNDFCFK